MAPLKQAVAVVRASFDAVRGACQVQLADQAAIVSCVIEEFGDKCLARGEIRVSISVHMGRRGIAAGEEGGAAWRTDRALRGKESIMGAIAALEAWKTRDHEGIRRTEREALTLWETALLGIDGVTPRIVPDPTKNPLDRLQVEIDVTKTGRSAAQVAAALGARSPSIVVRNHEVEHDYFQLDPCNLLPGQAALVASAVAEVLTSDTLPNTSSDARNGGVKSYLSWLD